MLMCFEPTVSTLRRFVARLAASDRAIGIALEAATEEQLRLGAHGEIESLRAVCEALTEEAAGCASIEAVRAAPLFDAFAARVAVPPRLLQAGPAANLLRFIASAPKAAERRALQAARAAAEASERVRELRAATDAEEVAHVEANRRCLAASDHLPFRATLSGGGGADAWSFAVASHNVQELVEDGVNHYVSALPIFAALPEARALRRRLLDAMLSDTAARAQQEAVAKLLDAQLDARSRGGGGCDAVCLQEVGVRLLGFLEEHCARHELQLHASAPSAASAAAAASCAAMTCIVSRRAFAPLDDVSVDFSVKARTRTRRFAAALFEGDAGRPPLALVSVHVLHAKEGGGAEPGDGGVAAPEAEGQPTNADFIAQSIRAVGRRLKDVPLVRGGTILAVGDFNGRHAHARTRTHPQWASLAARAREHLKPGIAVARQPERSARTQPKP
eukprot:3166378-Prymnesium_polylepis.1